MKGYVIPTAQVEDEKACTVRSGAIGFVRVGWVHSHMPRKGCGTMAKPEQVYTQTSGRQSRQQGAPAVPSKTSEELGLVTLVTEGYPKFKSSLST